MIYLDKGKWLKDGQIKCHNREINFSNIEPFLDKTKSLNLFDSNLTKFISKPNSKGLESENTLENLEHLEI